MTTNAPLSIESLFTLPALSKAQLSPDGQLIAYVAPWEGRLNVWVRTFATSDGEISLPRRLTSDKKRNIDGFTWTMDSVNILYVQDTAGDENWHLHRTSVSDPEFATVDLTPFPGVRVMNLELSQRQPDKAFIQMNRRAPELIDVYEIDLTTGALTVLAESPQRFVGWIPVTDNALHAIVINDNGDHELARYENGNFIPITLFAGRDYPLGPLPIRVMADGRSVIFGSNRGTDRTRLARIDLETGEETEIDSHPFFSLDTPRPESDPRFPSSLIMNSFTGELLGARYLGDRQVIHPLTPEFKHILLQLESLSEAEIGHVGCDASGLRWIAEFTDDQNPGTTWVYDDTTGRAAVLGHRYPHIDAKQLAGVRAVKVKSRDGLELPCHVTLPLNMASSSLPCVLLVHGGPWYRDTCAYDPEVQFFASRGYAVLQVNFRGSTGYGKAFMQAAIGQFAGRMHEDLIDALDWLIARGVADPNRVAIYGCSYGGYAALVGASFTPDRFAAAIDYSGIVDLRALVDGAAPFLRPMLVNNYFLYMGDPADPEQNRDMLARSPISRVSNIRSPLLVIHGANDARVSRTQADTVVEVARKNGVMVEYLLNEEEGHWFINQDSNRELYQTIERFLAIHLRGHDAEQ
jgi:dipeptidyl aminopeptidase/acylaminoacyl peptidase